MSPSLRRGIPLHFSAAVQSIKTLYSGATPLIEQMIGAVPYGTALLNGT